MLKKLLSKVFAVSPEVLDFISDSKKNYRRRLYLLIPLAAWTSFFAIISPLFLKWTVDSLTQGWTSLAFIQLKDVWQLFLVIVLGLALIQILDYGFQYIKGVVLLKLNKQSEVFLEDKFNNFLTKFDGAFLSAENNLRLIRNLQWNIRETQEKILNLGQKFAETITGLTTLVFVLPLIHPLLLVLIFISVVIDSLMDYLQNQAWRRYELVESRQNEQRRELQWRINWYFNRLLENGWIQQILQNYSQRRAKWVKTSINQGSTDQVFAFLKNLSSMLLNIASLVIAGWLFIRGEIPIGTFVVFELYITRVKSQLQGLGEIFRWIFELRFELFRYDFLLHISPKLDYSVANKPEFKKISKITIQNLEFTYPAFYQEEREYFEKMKSRILGATSFDKKIEELEAAETKKEENERKETNLFKRGLNWIRNRLSYQSLSVWQRKSLQRELKELEKMFELSDKNQPVLKGINLVLEAGKVYGVVGYNGAGKTTLTKLIKRTIDPSKGKILIENEELKKIDPIHWKNFLANIEQENFMWDSLSVRENLLLGIPEEDGNKISDEILWQAIDKVGLREKISDLDLIMGENLELSGGQLQLLEIARVYLQNKPIMILDEGTNQLDAIKEQNVLELINEIKKDSIVIFITHRMTTTQKCDEIIVLEDGVIKAQGKPKELLESQNSNLFKTFWQTQVQTKA